MKNICAAILAGGRGTRLRPALRKTPKVLARVGDRPFITILLDQLGSQGVEKVVLLTGYQAEEVRRTLGSRYGGLTLTYSVETTPLGTAGALRQALPRLEGETVLLLNGDSFCEVDLPRFIAEHRRRPAEFSMVLARVPDSSRFGQVQLAADGKILQFREKQDDNGTGLINAGIYLLEKSLVKEVPPGKAFSLEREALPAWLSARRLYGFLGGGRFLDIGTPLSYAQAENFFERRLRHDSRVDEQGR